MKSFISYLQESKKKKSIKEDAIVAAGAAGAASDGLSTATAQGDSEIVQNSTDDDDGYEKHQTGANKVLGKPTKGDGIMGKDDFHLPDMMFKYDRFGGASTYKKSKKKKLPGFDNSVVLTQLKKLFEHWHPEFDEKPENEWGEEWSQLERRHWLYSVIDSICSDCMLDPEADHQPDSIYLYSIHYVINSGHYIVHLNGGTNGSNDPKLLQKYMALMKKFVTKLLDVEEISNAWLIDFTNDCADDVWDLRLGIRLREEEKDAK